MLDFACSVVSGDSTVINKLSKAIIFCLVLHSWLKRYKMISNNVLMGERSMLTTKLIHPQIMAALAKCGHGSKILIADGNYPLAEKTGTAEKVFLGLTRGNPTVTEVLDALMSVISVEKAEVMVPEEGPEPAVFAEFRDMLGLPLEGLGRYEFYDACMKENGIVLAVSTGEQRVFANLLITVGVA